MQEAKGKHFHRIIYIIYIGVEANGRGRSGNGGYIIIPT